MTLERIREELTEV